MEDITINEISERLHRDLAANGCVSIDVQGNCKGVHQLITACVVLQRTLPPSTIMIPWTDLGIPVRIIVAQNVPLAWDCVTAALTRRAQRASSDEIDYLTVFAEELRQRLMVDTPVVLPEWPLAA